jgi:hypothetical protein
MGNSRTPRVTTAHLLLAWGCRQHLTPPSRALLDIRVVGLRGVAIVPVLGRGRGGLDHHRRGRHHHGGVRIIRPVRPPTPIRPPERPDPDPHADPWASKPAVEAVASVPMASVPVACVRLPLVPVPTPVGVPWQGAAAEQYRQHDEDPHPLRPCAHGHHLSGITLSCPSEGV